MRPGSVRSWYRVLRSLQLPVLAADGADAHALEALRDRVAEEPDRLHGLREEVGVDHLAASPGVVLVHDREQRFLERADAVCLRARVALLRSEGDVSMRASFSGPDRHAGHTRRQGVV